jgi:hypothetical protein
MCEDCSFGIATALAFGAQFPKDERDVSLLTASTSVLLPTQPPIKRTPGALPQRVKVPGRESDHSSPSSAEVKNYRAKLLFDIVGGGVQLGPLGTAAISRLIVPAPADFDDEEIGRMMIGRGNRSTRRKPASVPLCPPQTPHAARMATRAAAV